MASMYPSFLSGHCFDPTDEELVTCYLAKKLGGDGEMPGRVPNYDVVIPTVDLYCDAAAYPWRVCQRLAYPYGMGTTEFYCFTPRRRMYDNGARPVRTVGAGTWKANGGDDPIYHRGVLVGHKTDLTFKLAPPGSDGLPRKGSALVNTHWVMHEYRLEDPGFQKMVLCRVRSLWKERKVEKGEWSPPWWEQQEEGCSSAVTIGGGNNKKRKTASSGDDATVAPQKLRRRAHDSKGKRPATAEPLEDEVAYTHDFEPQGQPIFVAAPVAMVPSPVASALPGPLSSVTATDDEDDDALSFFARELETELLGSSEEEGMYHAEASCTISSFCGVLPPRQQGQDLPCCIPTADGHCTVAQHAAAVLEEPSSVVLEVPSSNMEEAIPSGDRQTGPSHGSPCLDADAHNTEPPWVGDVTADPVINRFAETEEQVDLRPSGNPPLSDYGATSMIISPPEEGTYPEAGNSCSIPDMQQLYYYGNVTLDAMGQAYQFAEEEEDGMLIGYLPLWEWS